MWDIDYKNSDPMYNEKGEPTNKAIVYTMIFNTYIWMHIFNEFNSRKVGAHQYNVFTGLITNWVFLVVMTVIILLQVFFVQFCGKLANTAPLTGKQHAFCILMGSTTLLVSAILKLLPTQWSSKLPHFVNENNQVEDDKLMAAFNKQAKAKVMKRD